MTMAVGTEQTITQNPQDRDRDGVMLGLWLFRSVKFEKRKLWEGRMGWNSATAPGWKWSQCAHNAAWQQVKECPISSHYWPTSPLSSSFILPSWAHLSFPFLHPGTTVLSGAPGWDTHRKWHHLTSDMAPEDWWAAAWQTYIWTKNGCPLLVTESIQVPQCDPKVSHWHVLSDAIDDSVAVNTSGCQKVRIIRTCQKCSWCLGALILTNSADKTRLSFVQLRNSRKERRCVWGSLTWCHQVITADFYGSRWAVTQIIQT